MNHAPITVCIGTYGDHSWSQLAKSRAVPSAQNQSLKPAHIHHIHAESIAQARNTAAQSASTPWLCFLDADDELDHQYLEAMNAATAGLDGNWLLQPATMGVHPDGREEEPIVIPPKPLIDGNFMVIGTLICTEQFHRLGGFDEWDYAEDWDLWLRAWIDGAQFRAVPNAVYRVFVSTGRNSCPRDQMVRTYNAIRNHHLPVVHQLGLHL